MIENELGDVKGVDRFAIPQPSKLNLIAEGAYSDTLLVSHATPNFSLIGNVTFFQAVELTVVSKSG